jgi:hypothetical protein
MLRGLFDSAGDLSSAKLRGTYDDRLVETIEAVGLDRVASQAGVDRDRLTALIDGQSPDLTLAEAATILGTDEELPDAKTIEAEARDILLMGMSVAVLDVETLAAGVQDDLTPKEIQQKAEGRHPLPLDEYALLHSYIEGKKR